MDLWGVENSKIELSEPGRYPPTQQLQLRLEDPGHRYIGHVWGEAGIAHLAGSQFVEAVREQGTQLRTEYAGLCAALGGEGLAAP